MNRVTLFHLYVCTLLLVLLVAAQASYGQTAQFVLQNIRLQPGERVDSIEVHVRSGSFVGLDPLPIGWYLIIDNDPSQQTSIKGDARVGTAALEAGQLSSLRIRIQRIPYGGEKLSISGMLIVTTDFVSERKISLSNENFREQATSPK